MCASWCHFLLLLFTCGIFNKATYHSLIICGHLGRLWIGLGFLYSFSPDGVQLLLSSSADTFSELFHASLDFSHCAPLYSKPLWRCYFGEGFCVCPGRFCVKQNWDCDGWTFSCSFSSFLPGHTAFPDWLPLCFFTTGAIEGMYNLVCQSTSL